MTSIDSHRPFLGGLCAECASKHADEIEDARFLDAFSKAELAVSLGEPFEKGAPPASDRAARRGWEIGYLIAARTSIRSVTVTAAGQPTTEVGRET